MLCKYCNERPVPQCRLQRNYYICNRCFRKKYGDGGEKRRKREREIIIEYYGKRCRYCGSTNNLHIDHVNGDGKAERLKLKKNKWYRHIIESGFPDWYQVLCKDCNQAKGTKTPDEFFDWVRRLVAYQGFDASR
jgi:5-methylcytosine-specific restriction endonuclease McrA